MIVVLVLVGIFFGGFFGGWLIDCLGCCRLFFVGFSLFVFVFLVQYGVDLVVVLFVLCFLIGVVVGIEYLVVIVLLVEFLLKKYCGLCLVILIIFWFVGVVFVYLVGDLILCSGGEDVWCLVLVSIVVIGVVLFLLCIGIFELLCWLLSKGCDVDVEWVICQVYGEVFLLENLFEQVLEWKVIIWYLFYVGYGKCMFFVILFWICLVIFVFVVYVFVFKVLLVLNLKGDWVFYGLVVIILLFVIGCIIVICLINCIGWCCMLLYSFFWFGLVLFGLGVFYVGLEVIIFGLFGVYVLFIGGVQVL